MVSSQARSTPSSSPAKSSSPAAAAPRRSSRISASSKAPWTPIYDYDLNETPKASKTSRKSDDRRQQARKSLPFSLPSNPTPPEPKRRKRSDPGPPPPRTTQKKRVYYKKVVYDGGEFEVGDDVYVKRKDGVDFDDEEEPEAEECRVCFEVGDSVMIECDDCLGGFHLKCLNPPLKRVPDGDWVCPFCRARKEGKLLELPKPPEGKRRRTTAKEKLLSSDLWAARIKSLWREPDGTYWAKCRWFMIPEETAVGRQPHNLRRELYRTNHLSDIEMESIIRHCTVLSPKEFAQAADEGDDVFYCEYEYDIHWSSFKCLADVNDCDENKAGINEESKPENGSESSSDDDFDFEEDNVMQGPRAHDMAANSYKGRAFGLQRIGMKRIPHHVRSHKQSELGKAQAALLLTALPKSLPCRNKEMKEITTFIKSSISDDHCAGRCLYVHGVPGTGKTMSVLAVMKALRSEVEAGSFPPCCFIEINSLKLASPENIYRVIYEGLTGHRIGWKKALQQLTERFTGGSKTNKQDTKPCVLLIDELDLLLTRNQSVLYNIFDWPTRAHSKLVIIGVANTMDLPERLLPRISSRMGVQRLCFGPYNYQQLQEIILCRLEGIDAYEEQAIEFASRKVAAMSGDARRALEICRRAAELADCRFKQLSSSVESSDADKNIPGKCIFGMAEVESAIQEVFHAPHIRIMRTSSKLSKIILVAMVREFYRSGTSEITFEKLATAVFSLCSNNREEVPGWDTIMRLGCKLGESRIILCQDAAKHMLQKLQLNVPSDDVAFALKDCPEIPWLAKYL